MLRALTIDPASDDITEWKKVTIKNMGTLFKAQQKKICTVLTLSGPGFPHGHI